MTNNHLTDKRLAQLAKRNFCQTRGEEYTPFGDEVVSMAAELQERRKAEQDSEPVAWTDEEELCDANAGACGYLFGIGSSANKFADPRRQIMLYRHAQPAPVVTFYRDGIEAAAKWIDRQREAYGTEHGWSDPDTGAFEFGNDAQREYSSTLEELADGIRALHPNAGNSPVIPDGYVMVPMRLTAENGAKGALSGEFSETKFVNCPECFGDDECETCDGSGRIKITVPVSWTTIKEIWTKGVDHFSAAPQEVKGE